ncbi:MAG: Tab2/Atab2 family RNA-binding protein [Chroococcales cyanobacterium]
MSKTWELDFYSKPILDEKGKKRWEVLICETPTDTCSTEELLRFSKYCSNSEVNSMWLGEAINEAIAIAGKPPTQIRFFRRQMNNMITKACNDLGITSKPSRRTVALYRWLQERMDKVYPLEEGFQGAGLTPSVQFETPKPERLPDALQGDRWAFVTLEASSFTEMQEWDIDFAEAFPILGEKSLVPQLTPETIIPGLIVFSNRAKALAGWMSGLELGFLKPELEEPGQVVLETGFNERWILANLTDQTTRAEAQGFAETKDKAQGVHFLAIQTDPNSESFAGFWLLQELNLA